MPVSFPRTKILHNAIRKALMPVALDSWAVAVSLASGAQYPVSHRRPSAQSGSDSSTARLAEFYAARLVVLAADADTEEEHEGEEEGGLEHAGTVALRGLARPAPRSIPLDP
jgi:hypothetical protein